jgi:hypothetical protein
MSENTRTVYLTTVGNGHVSASGPGQLGQSHSGGTIRYAIEGVPADVTDQDAIAAFRQVGPMRNHGRDRSDGESWTYQYDELRPGAILR